MALPIIQNCPSSLAPDHDTFSRTALKHLFFNKKVSAILDYNSPNTNENEADLFNENKNRISISGVQEKFSVLLEKNKLRLVKKNELGQYILKPIPQVGKNAQYMPANEHLTMQIAKQTFNIETAENGLVFFKDGSPAYITKRFDFKKNGEKWAQEDFASLAGRTPQTHGEDYKYLGNYLELFTILKKHVPAYMIESIKLYKLILFNYLFSNGDAHFKNFSLIETALGDYKLSPAYDLLNSRIHIEDRDFALEDGLLPPNLKHGKIKTQFYIFGEQAEIPKLQIDKIFKDLTSKENQVYQLIEASFLSDQLKRNYKQAYQTRLKKLLR